MYIVIEDFFDLQDEYRHYHVGDTFPREGYGVTPNRLDELLGNNNLRGKPVIKEDIKETIKPRRKRGGKNVSDRPDTSC